jgi:hypothetical protein
MTSLTTMAMPHSRRRKPATELVDDLTRSRPQVTDRSAHAMHIVLCRSSFAPAINMQGHNLRLAIWIAGWHIAIYDEFGKQPRRFGKFSFPASRDA